jgi:cysteine desulfurase
MEKHGVEVIYLSVDRDGRLSPSELDAAITPRTSLVSVQWVNNETGVIQPVEEISEICQKHGVLFHSDAAQAVGKVNIDLSALPVDFLSLSGHKFHGPQGVGALHVRNQKLLSPIIFGGPQEGGLRPGTENLPGIVGIGKAAEIRHERLDQTLAKLRALRDQFEQQVFEKVPGVEINGDHENRVCNTTNILFRDVDGQALVARLDMKGIRCSQSSACTNMHPEPSYVLRAMGFSEKRAYSSVRFSFSEQNSEEEVEYAVTHLAEICKLLRDFAANRRQFKAAGWA